MKNEKRWIERMAVAVVRAANVSKVPRDTLIASCLNSSWNWTDARVAFRTQSPSERS
jgi:hypothetical protein